MTKTLIGVNDNGTPRYHYEFPEMDVENEVLISTGPITGRVDVADGTSYNVDDDWIVVPHRHHAQILVAIHAKHHAEGRYLDAPLPTVEEVQARLDTAK